MMTFRTWRKRKSLTLDDCARLFKKNRGTVEVWDRNPRCRPIEAHRKEIKRIAPDCPLAG